MSGDSADNPQPEYSVTDSSDPIRPGGSGGTEKGLLCAASRRLESIEVLLLDPTPQRIQMAEQLFELVAGDIRALENRRKTAGQNAAELCADAQAIQKASRRIIALLNGALRVHWHRLRRMGSYHETYTSIGANKVCIPPVPSLDLKM